VSERGYAVLWCVAIGILVVLFVTGLILAGGLS